MQTDTSKIFISHAWKDKALVRQLESELKAAGADVWVDHSGIRGGDNLPERINDALKWCNTLLLIWSDAAHNSHWVKLEWTNAIALKKLIIPCVLDKTELPSILANTLYLDFRDINFGITQLLRALNLARQSSVHVPTSTTEELAGVLQNQLTEKVESDAPENLVVTGEDNENRKGFKIISSIFIVGILGTILYIGLSLSVKNNVPKPSSQYNLQKPSNTALEAVLLRSITTKNDELIRSVSFSPDGQVLASGIVDGTVRLWRVNDGRLLNTLKGTGNIVTFSPDGSMLATCDLRKILLWRVSDSKLLRSLTSADTTDFLNGVAFSPNGQFLAATNGRVAILWRVSDSTLLRTFGSDEGFSVVFSPDEQVLFTGGKGIKRWRVSDGKLLGILAEPKEYSSYTPLALDPLGQTLAAGEYGSIDLFRVSDSRLLCTLKTEGMSGMTEELVFSPNGNMLVSSHLGATYESDEKIRLWQVNECHQIQTISKSAGSYYRFAFSPDGKLLAIGGSQIRGEASYGIIRLFQVKPSNTALEIENSLASKFFGEWKLATENRYLRISKDEKSRIKFYEGWENNEGKKVWAEKILVEYGDGIYLDFSKGKLEGKFVSYNFRATHGHPYTYQLILALTSNNKLLYTVNSQLGKEETEATKISD